MIKSYPHNAIDFSGSFSRKSKSFDPSLQRVRNIFSLSEGNLCFVFEPDSMPVEVPTASMILTFNDGTVTVDHSEAVELATSIIYFFELSLDYSVKRTGSIRIAVTGYTDVMYSEFCEYVPTELLADEAIVEVIGSNADDTHGYLGTTHPACGFFEISELDSDVFGVDKTEYKYSYGRSKILEAEIFIKKRLTFLNLSMYQQNLLKWLCNCESLSIRGIDYQLVSDFTEKNKNAENEICDLTAEFVEVDRSFFAAESTEVASEIMPTNLFM